MERCSVSLVIREMQIKTTMRCHYTLTRLAIMAKCCRKTTMFTDSWWECKNGQPLWKTVWQFFIKLSIYLPCDPTILLLGIYPREMKTCSQKDLYMIVHGCFIHNSPKLETM